MSSGAQVDFVPAIVVVAYERTRSLSRLLASLRNLRVPGDVTVPLVVSIDGGVPETTRVAQEFDWPFGPKEVISQPERLGLRNHVLTCGDLTAEYGSIVMLEDDLYASPEAYRYAQGALSHYADQPSVAGVSLWAYRVYEYLSLSFYPIQDDKDAFFIQLPSSWGQAWTAQQWAGFRSWLAANEGGVAGPLPRMPEQMVNWSTERIWTKGFVSYMIDTDKYFAYPRVSFTSNCGDPGTNIRRSSTNPISSLVFEGLDWRFPEFGPEAIRYDAWLEPHPETIERRWPGLGENGITFDFFGQKSQDVDTPLTLSSRPCSSPKETFPMLLLPLPHNLEIPGEGSFFSLGRTEDFEPLPRVKLRRMFELLNGEVRRAVAAGILVDRARTRLGLESDDPSTPAMGYIEAQRSGVQRG